jgi:hypothetical protein
MADMKFAAMGAGALLAASAMASHGRVVLTRGTVIPVTLSQNLSSDHSMPGDTFTCTVRSNYLGLPAGTRVRGVVDRAKPKTGDKPGTLSLSFTRLVMPSGKLYDIAGSPVGLDDKSVRTGADGRLVAKNGSGNHRLEYVGYGAGAGLALSLIGDQKHAVRNTILGAAAGLLAGALQKSDQHKTNNVLLKSGSSLGVMVGRDVDVTWKA